MSVIKLLYIYGLMWLRRCRELPWLGLRDNDQERHGTPRDELRLTIYVVYIVMPGIYLPVCPSTKRRGSVQVRRFQYFADVAQIASITIHFSCRSWRRAATSNQLGGRGKMSVRVIGIIEIGRRRSGQTTDTQRRAGNQ